MENEFRDNNKKSVTIFFCDICGTVDGGFTLEDCYRFAELLKKLKEKNGSDYLFFGMSSTEHPDVVDYYEKCLSRYFSDDILLMEKIQNAEALREAKISCALLYIQNLQKYYDIKGVYCADDIEILQELFKNLLKDILDIDLNIIVPKSGENNLEFINKEIEERFIKESSKIK